MTAFLLISTGILLLIAVPIGMAMGTASLLTILQGGTLNALTIRPPTPSPSIVPPSPPPATSASPSASR